MPQSADGGATPRRRRGHDRHRIDPDRGAARRRFLAALALAPGAISIDALAEALWGDAIPENWKPALRNVVARVRSRLASIGGGDDHVVVTTATGYRLAPACTLDVHAVLADVANAGQALADGDPDRAFELGSTAADRLAQPLLADVDAAWVAGYRARVDAARVRSLQVAAAAARDTGHPDRAVDLAGRAVADNPLDEESHRQLIAALAAAGDRVGALRGYEECRRLLADELGIAPAPATIALHLDVLGREPSRPARVRSGKPLLGRDRELATLREVVVPGADGHHHRHRRPWQVAPRGVVRQRGRQPLRPTRRRGRARRHERRRAAADDPGDRTGGPRGRR